MIRIVGFKSRTDPEDHKVSKKEKNKIDRKKGEEKSCASKLGPGERGLARTLRLRSPNESANKSKI